MKKKDIVFLFFLEMQMVFGPRLWFLFSIDQFREAVRQKYRSGVRVRAARHA